MKIKIIGGFCPGVARSYNEVLKLKEIYNDKQLVMIGDLVHNDDVLAELNKKGIITVNSIGDLAKLKTEKSIIPVIRAHGITVEEEEFLKKSFGANGYIDLTCIFVKNGPQKAAKEFSERGYRVIIFGKKEHPEVEGIASRAKTGYVVYENPDEVNADHFKKGEHVGVVAQTTSEIEKYWILGNKLESIGLKVEAIDTYCETTKRNQKAVKEIAKWADLVIVVGGKKSSNTKRLAEICSRYKTTYKIENAKELNPKWFKKDYKIGIAAGASTPDWIIDDAKEKIERYYKT